MQATTISGPRSARAPIYLGLRPLGRQAEEGWCVRYDGELLTLLRPGNEAVLRVHREEAARYVRFARHIRVGWVLTVAVVPGMKLHAFACNYNDVQMLLSWLPNKSPKEARREIRFAGGAVILFGLIHLLLPGQLSWVWGAALAGVGFIGLASPSRNCYLLNGVALIAAGLWSLVPWQIPGLDPRVLPVEERLIPVVVGSLLILWGIQQASMLGPENVLRAARAIRDRDADLPKVRSPLVSRIAAANALAGIACGAYAATVALTRSGTGLARLAMDPLLADMATYAVLALLALLSAAMFLVRRGPAYFEAKVSAPTSHQRGRHVGMGSCDVRAPRRHGGRTLRGNRLAGLRWLRGTLPVGRTQSYPSSRLTAGIREPSTASSRNSGSSRPRQAWPSPSRGSSHRRLSAEASTTRNSCNTAIPSAWVRH